MERISFSTVTLLLLFLLSSIQSHRGIEGGESFNSSSIISLQIKAIRILRTGEQYSQSTSESISESSLSPTSFNSFDSTTNMSFTSNQEESSTHTPINQNTTSLPSIYSVNSTTDMSFTSNQEESSTHTPIPTKLVMNESSDLPSNDKNVTLSNPNEIQRNNKELSTISPTIPISNKITDTLPEYTNHSTTQSPPTISNYRLVLFTTGEHYSPSILQKAKVVKNWYSILQQNNLIHTVVFTKSPAFIQLFNGTSTVITTYSVNKYGFPIVTNMFDVIRKSFNADYYGYLNFDIIIENNILSALNYLSSLVSHNVLSPKHELVGRVSPVDTSIVSESLSPSQFSSIYNQKRIRNPSSSVRFFSFSFFSFLIIFIKR